MSKIEVKMSIKEFDDLRKRSEELDITIRALLNINTVLAAPIYQTSEQRLKRITDKRKGGLNEDQSGSGN